MFRKIVIFGALLAVSLAEVPVNGPYAPSGWKPQGRPFDLPNEYFVLQAQRRPAEVEITKERVDFAGQFTSRNAGQVVSSNAYLPPSSNSPDEVDEPLGVDILRVQGLPSGSTAQFKVFRASQLNTREYFPQRQSSQVRRPQKFSARIQFSGPTQQPVKVPAAQYGAPVVQPAAQYGAPVVQPASQYGPPAVQSVGYPEPRNPEDNSENEEYSTVTKGEYFVLTPEKTLQKVSYTTSQTEEEASNNGFTAQLKYSPVDQINGPLYKYNEKGQLVRISKK